MIRIVGPNGLVTTTLRPQSRTDIPPPPFVVTSRPAAGPPNYATPSDADFQEGFRILNDLLIEEGGADIRQNLVGGSDVSFSGSPYPSIIVANSTSNNQNRPNAPLPAVRITPAKEQGVLLAGSPPKNDETSSEEKRSNSGSDQKTEETGISYGPPGYQAGPPSSHVSYMYSDPHGSSGGYNLFREGYVQGPPPPFTTIGNSIIPPPIPPAPETFNAPPQQKAPEGGYSAPPPETKSAPTPMPMMMMPLSQDQASSGPQPSSDEVQRALAVLARFATNQAKTMGVATGNQMMLMQQPDPNSAYGTPQTEASPPSTSYGTPSTSYGTPPQQQSTPIPSFLPVQVTPPTAPSTDNNQITTTEADDAITISGLSASPEESSPFPSYGPPQHFGGGGGGGGYSESSGGYSSGGGWSTTASSGGIASGVADIIGAKANALKSIGNAAIGGIQQVGALKAGILNAGLNVIGGLGATKSNLANSLKIPIVSQSPKPVYGPPSSPPPPPGWSAPQQQQQQQQQYGPPQQQMGWGSNSGGGGNGGGPVSAIIGAARNVVGGVVRTGAAKAKAVVGIGLSKNEFVKNHFVIKGQAFTDSVSKKIANKNQYWQDVLKHVSSIFEAATQKPSGGWSR